MWSVLAYILYPKQKGTFQRWNYTHTHKLTNRESSQNLIQMIAEFVY